MSKQRAVLEWLMTCPVFKRLFFSFSAGEYGDVQVYPIGGVVKEDYNIRYMDNSGQKYLDYEISQFMPSPVIANSNENVDILEEFFLIAEWINSQDKQKLYPFKECEEIQIFNSGNIAARDETGAKYTFQFRILFDYNQ